jgi:hypothetical protein
MTSRQRNRLTVLFVGSEKTACRWGGSILYCYKRCYNGDKNFKRFNSVTLLIACCIKLMIVAMEKPSTHNINLWSMVAIALDGTFLDHIISKIYIRLKTFVLHKNRPKRFISPPLSLSLSYSLNTLGSLFSQWIFWLYKSTQNHKIKKIKLTVATVSV